MSAPPRPLSASAPLHVLLVEDNRINQTVAVRQLERLGHRVEVAADGAQGVARAVQGGLDLVLMDIQMPQMDGLSATRAIRAHEAQTGRIRVPIIAMTAQTLHGDRQQCLDHGMDGYVGKPVSADELAAEVARVMAAGTQPPTTGTRRVADADPALAEIDLDELRDRFEGDSALLADLVELARPDWPLLAQALRSAAQQRDVPELRRRAHAIIGMAGNLSAVTVVSLARRLGPAAAEGRWHDVDALLAELEPRLAWLAHWAPPKLTPEP